jgi:hypothetical protein
MNADNSPDKASKLSSPIVIFGYSAIRKHDEMDHSVEQQEVPYSVHE